MDNIEANEDIMRSASSARRSYADEVIQLQDIHTLPAPRLLPQPELGQLKPDFDALNRNWEVNHQSEDMDLQKDESCEMAQVQGVEAETGLTAHHEESSANHSSTSQPQSSKHNMPAFLARNIKKLIKIYLKSAAKTQGLQELNHLYLKFVLKNIKESLKSLNSFWFTPTEAKVNEKAPFQLDATFSQFIKKLKRPELLRDIDEEWSETMKKCQNFFKSFILSNEEELLKLAQDRKFSKESRKTGLYEYSERFLTCVKEGSPRGKDVKARRSTQ